MPPATCQAACAGVEGYGRVTHSDGLMYDCYEAPAAATDGPFASSVVDNMYLLWVFPATLAELATDAGSISTLLGSVGIHTNLSEVVHYANLSSKLQMSLVFWTDRFGIPFGLVPHRTKMIVVVNGVFRRQAQNVGRVLISRKNNHLTIVGDCC